MHESPRLRSLTVAFAARLFGAFAAFVGLLLGILYAGIGLLIDVATGALGAGTALAFLAILGMPLLLLPLGAVGGALFARVYNAVARRFGGLRADLRLAP